MRFNKSVMAAALLLAFTVFGGHDVYAIDTKQTEQPTDATQSSTAPQTTTPKNEQITIAPGQNLTQIAEQYRTTVDAILAENNLANADLIEPGQVLSVTPGEVKLADKYTSLKAAAEAFIVPPAPVAAPVTVAQQVAPTRVVTSHAAPASSAGNTYGYGTCTWYVKSMKPNLPNRLGNAGPEWIANAAAAGYGTGTAPAIGAIGVTAGHVVLVDSVNADGTVNISEMNYGGGIGVVHHRTVPAGSFRYIYA